MANNPSGRGSTRRPGGLPRAFRAAILVTVCGWSSPARGVDAAALSAGGLWSGYRTQVAHFLDRGLTVAVQTNRDGRVDLESIVVRIARLAVDTDGGNDEGAQR